MRNQEYPIQGDQSWFLGLTFPQLTPLQGPIREPIFVVIYSRDNLKFRRQFQA